MRWRLRARGSRLSIWMVRGLTNSWSALAVMAKPQRNRNIMDNVVPLYVPAPYQDSAESGRLILRDGSTATVRLSAPSDAAAMTDLFRRLSDGSREHRFFSAGAPSPDLLRSLCDSSHPDKQLTLVVSRSNAEREDIIAMGSYIGISDKSAEVSFAVEDRFQGKGIGSHLLERLALLAVKAGFTRFWAVTHPDNRGMIDVFRHSGFPMKETQDEGAVEIDFSV